MTIYRNRLYSEFEINVPLPFDYYPQTDNRKPLFVQNYMHTRAYIAMKIMGHSSFIALIIPYTLHDYLPMLFPQLIRPYVKSVCAGIVNYSMGAHFYISYTLGALIGLTAGVVVGAATLSFIYPAMAVKAVSSSIYNVAFGKSSNEYTGGTNKITALNPHSKINHNDTLLRTSPTILNRQPMHVQHAPRPLLTTNNNEQRTRVSTVLKPAH